MISINATLVLQIIHFLILAYILNRIMFRPILRVISERDRHIEDEKGRLDKLEDETRALIDKCAAIERDTRRKAGDDSNRLKRDAIEAAEKIFSDTRDEAALIKERAGREVEEKLKEAQRSLRSEAMVLADEITEKVIGRRISI